MKRFVIATMCLLGLAMFAMTATASDLSDTLQKLQPHCGSNNSSQVQNTIDISDIPAPPALDTNVNVTNSGELTTYVNRRRASNTTIVTNAGVADTEVATVSKERLGFLGLKGYQITRTNVSTAGQQNRIVRFNNGIAQGINTAGGGGCNSGALSGGGCNSGGCNSALSSGGCNSGSGCSSGGSRRGRRS